MATFSFHPEAMAEYREAVYYYFHRASPRVAEAFLVTIETAIDEILKSPYRWGIIEEPGIRRYVCGRFPFVLYYQCEREQIIVYAIMHCSRKPGYWRHRPG